MNEQDQKVSNDEAFEIKQAILDAARAGHDVVGLASALVAELQALKAASCTSRSA